MNKKVFVAPFRLALRRKDGETVLMRVETLAGLKKVMAAYEAGDYLPGDGGMTLDRQLWGLLAEHVGFLRTPSISDGEMAAGLEPLGEQGALVDDMTAIMGSVESGLDNLAVLRRLAAKRPETGVHVADEATVEGGVITQKGVRFPSDDMVARALLDADPEPTMLPPDRQLDQVNDLDNLRNPLQDPDEEQQ